MLQIVKKLRVLLDKKQKRTMAGLMVLMIIGAFLQTAGVGMLVQSVNVVIDPQVLEKSALARGFYDFLGCRDFKSFSITVMALLVAVFAAKNAFLFIQQKLTFAFVYTNQFATSERMMRNYLRRGYEFYLNADTAVVQRSITSDVNNMYALILALLQLLSDGVMSLFVVGYCLMTNGVMTVLLAVSLVLLMAAVKKVLKPIMHKAGEDNQNYYSSLFKWISQTVQGIKEVKIICKEQYFVDEYRKCGRGYVNAVQRYSLYNNVPKLLIETVCIAVMMGYMIALTVMGTATDNMLEVLATLAAAAFVLLPAVNRINNQINSIAYFEPFFMGVSDNLQDEIKDSSVDMSFAAEEEGRYERWCDGMFPAGQEGDYGKIVFPWKNVCVFDGERLLLAAYERRESLNVVLAVYGQEGQRYGGLYRHSSEGDWDGGFGAPGITPQGSKKEMLELTVR